MESYLNLSLMTVACFQPLWSFSGWPQTHFFLNRMPHGSFWAIFLTPFIDLYPFLSFSWKPEPQFHKCIKNKNWSHLEWGHIIEFILGSHHDLNNFCLLYNMIRIQVWSSFNFLAFIVSEGSTQVELFLPDPSWFKLWPCLRLRINHPAIS